MTQAMNRSEEFRLLVGEVQRTLGRILTTEELKILLSFRNYLDLPAEVVSMLVCYCKERLRRKGSNRNPSLRTIEKEAYAWAEQGINTLEEAAAYAGPERPAHPDGQSDAAAANLRSKSDPGRGAVCPGLAGYGF